MEAGADEKVDESATSSSTEEDEQDILDPRIQVELEKLNNASNKINILEKELDEARAFFRNFLTDATRTLKSLSNHLGPCIDKARSYFEALEQSKKAQEECQAAAMRYDKACSSLRAAKEMIAITEKKLQGDSGAFDATWQEMLNHADVRLLEAEVAKVKSEKDHQDATLTYNDLAKRTATLEKQLKRNIKKARPYYDQKKSYLSFLEEQKEKVRSLELAYETEKKNYALALKKLEQISEEIHDKRKRLSAVPMEPRQECIGAEADDAAESEDKAMSLSWSEGQLKRIISKRKAIKPLSRSALRSSLCIELGIGTDFDVGNILESPQSPSTKSIDLGAVFSQSTYKDYAVLEINGQELLDRTYKKKKKEPLSERKSVS